MSEPKGLADVMNFTATALPRIHPARVCEVNGHVPHKFEGIGGAYFVVASKGGKTITHLEICGRCGTMYCPEIADRMLPDHTQI